MSAVSRERDGLEGSFPSRSPGTGRQGFGRGEISHRRRELAGQVRRLRDEDNLLFREISERLGVSYSYVQGLYSDPDGTAARERKDRCGGVCENCGGPTTGSLGRAAAPTRCAACQIALQFASKVWTRDAIIDAIRRYAAAHGHPPGARDWQFADRFHNYPSAQSVYNRHGKSTVPFRRWADAIEAAGFPRPRVGARRHPNPKRAAA